MPTDDGRQPPRGRSSSIFNLSQVAKQLVVQALSGAEPDIAPTDLDVIERGAVELATTTATHLLQSTDLFAWSNQAEDVAAFLALYSLVLRRSAPSDTSDGTIARRFAKVRTHLSVQFTTLTQYELWQGLAFERLASAVLATDALQSFSRLFAETAEQLQPSAPASGTDRSEDVPNAAMGGGAQQLAGQRQRQSPGGPGQEEQRRGTRHQQQPDPREVDMLLRELFMVCRCFTKEMYGFYEYNGTSSVSRSIRSAGGSSGSSSGSGGGPAPAQHPSQAIHDRLHSSWVLEHWARLLLLATPAALSGGGTTTTTAHGRQQREALARQAAHLYQLWRTYHMVGFSWLDFVRRPCGCTLAATHMAHLCAALDGGSTFGLPMPTAFILPRLERRHVLTTSRTAATQHDHAAAERGTAAGLHPATVTLEAWFTLLGEALQEPPRTPGAAGQRTRRGPVGASTRAAGGEAGPSTAAAGGGDDGLGGEHGGRGVGVGSGGDTSGEAPGGSYSVCSVLPPLNRTATIHLCLRLAKGVLARWGEPLSGVGLVSEGELEVRGARFCELPKISSALVLHHALACARLALLPRVWGRERVRDATQAQLRAWWETYVAAVQHPEALLVIRPKLFAYPEWTTASAGISARPSADTAAALEAGLLPCLTRMVTRMGAGSGGGAVWVPPDRFPGVARCWDEAMLLGPLGQLSGLLSALGRRLRVAVEELRVVAGGGGRAPRGGLGARGGGRSVGWLASVVHDVMMLTHSCLWEMFLRVMMGALPAGVGLGGSGRLGGGADGEAGPGGAGQGQTVAPGPGMMGPGGDTVGARAAAGPGGEAAAAVASEGVPIAAPQTVAVRPSLAVAELLPALSHCVVVCAELGRAGTVRCGATVDGTADVMEALLVRGTVDGAFALDCAALLLARYLSAGCLQGDTGDDGGGSGSVGGGSGGGGSGSNDSVGGDGRDRSDVGAGGAQWREFLLRDIRLMELLGAAVELNQCAATAAAVPQYAGLALPLVRTVCLAATAFPGEFHAAVDSGSAATAAAAATAAESAGSASTVGAAGSSRPGGGPLRIPLRAVRSLLLSLGCRAELEYLTGVLGGCDPTPEMGQAMVNRYMMVFRQSGEGSAKASLRALVPPTEARGAVAAAAATATASGSGQR